jgi:glycosyltransferase involved in cell wall biosynthesis
MIAAHRARQTWSRSVDRYIALSEFGRAIFIEAGFPAQRIDVKPNFIEDPGEPDENLPRSGVFYSGRLSPEKGVRYLVEACVRHGFPLRIAGDGPELAALQKMASSNVTFLGYIQPTAVFQEMRRAAVVAIPSICYEQFPIAILNAFACATPTIVSRIGALPELIEDGATGFHFPPADSVALAERIGQALRDPGGCRRLGNGARRTFLERYTPGINIKLLKDIYKKALDHSRFQFSTVTVAGAQKKEA